MMIPRVWTDGLGASHFADLDLPEAMMPSASGLSEMQSTSSMPVESFRLVTTTPQAMARGWHPVSGAAIRNRRKWCNRRRSVRWRDAAA